MKRIVHVLVVALALGAGVTAGAALRQTPPPPVVVACDTAPLRQTIDSLTARISEQRVLVRLAEQQMKRYAAIVARDPSQAVFLRGWTNRAFSGVSDGP